MVRTKEFGLGVAVLLLFVVEPVVDFYRFQFVAHYHSATGPQFDLSNIAMKPPAVVLENLIPTLVYKPLTTRHPLTHVTCHLLTQSPTPVTS